MDRRALKNNGERGCCSCFKKKEVVTHDHEDHKHEADRIQKSMSNMHDHDHDDNCNHEGGIMHGYQQPGLWNYISSFMPNDNTDNRYTKF